MFEFLFIPIIVGIFLAAAAGALGSFVVWRKMAYFGDTLAHGSLFGIALGMAYQINVNVALILTCILLAVSLVIIEKKSRISTDSVLGIIAHSSLALGLVTLSLMDNVRIDLMAYLFGDILSASESDLLWIIPGTLAILCGLVKMWQPLLAITVNEDMAKIDGYAVDGYKIALMILIAFIVAIGMKFVGALIISSLMIIPAATARRFAQTPESMAVMAAITAMISVVAGISMSWFQDTPAGPSIVVAAAALFICAQLKKQS